MNKWLILSALLLMTACASSPSIEKDQTALIVIDVQNAYLPVAGQSDFLANIRLLIKEAREASIPVIYIRNIDAYYKEGSYGWQFHKEVKPLESDVVVEKHTISSYSNTELQSVLEKKDIQTLIMTGLASSYCYGNAVRQSLDRGFNVIVVSDAHGDPKPGRADDLNQVLSFDERVVLMKTEDMGFR